MLKIEIPESNKQLLREARYSQPHPRVLLKLDALFFKSFKIENSDMYDMLDICDNTLREYFKQYVKDGVKGLQDVNFYRPSCELKDYADIIEKHFTEHPPGSISKAVAIIESLTGIKRGETQTRKFLKSLNCRYAKTESVPTKALTEGGKNEQRVFVEKGKRTQSPNRRSKRGQANSRFCRMPRILFARRYWGIFGLSSENSGRQCRAENDTGVLGAINAITHDLCHVCNETCINALNVCDLLKQIRDICKTGIPITVVSDNAGYQRCKLVMQLADELNIELLFLPSYSPNLNIIERYWKWFRNDCLHCKYYETFQMFKNAIDTSLKKR